jgi:methyl-accepting chemotaxis protein
MFQSIRVKLVTCLLAIVLVSMLAIFFAVADSVERLSFDSYQEAAGIEINLVEDALSLFLENVQENVRAMSLLPAALQVHDRLPSYLNVSQAAKIRPHADDAVGMALEEAFVALLESHPSYMDVYIGTKFGGILTASDDKLPGGYDPRKRPWYKDAASNPDKALITGAYVSTNGEPCISVAKAVTKDNEVLGVAATDLSLERLTNLAKDIKIGETGYVMLFQGDGVVISDPKNSDTNFKNISELDKPGLKQLFELGDGVLQFDLDGKAMVGVIHTSPQFQWKIVTIINRSELMKPVRASVTQIGVIMAASLLLISLAIWLLANKIAIKPLRAVGDALQKVASGQYQLSLDDQRKDEIGEIFKAVQSMAGKLQANIGEITKKTQEAEEKAHTALHASEEAEKAREQAELAKAEGMLQAAQRLKGVVSQVSTISGEIHGFSSSIRTGAEAQSERIQTTATSMEEITATVLEVAKNSAQASETASEARDKAQQGKEIVLKTIDAMRTTHNRTDTLKTNMHHLGQKAEEIGTIMTVIEDIADQTNLLALNAAIEAARAGEAGRGFAVVADEVRKLAEKTMGATKEVGESIRSIQDVAQDNISSVGRAVTDLDSAVALSNESGRVLEEIVLAVERSSDQIQSIATAAEEQSAATEEITRSVDEINRIATDTSEGVNHTVISLEEMTGQLGELKKLVQELEDEKATEPAL